MGNTAQSGTDGALGAVHPHARGEHSAGADRLTGRPGSSPRPWGTQLTSRPFQARWRFIPTPVGNTSRRCQRRSAGSVHPHARGEHLAHVGSASLIDGSSPRPWGTQVTAWARHRSRRFIPTPVGNTTSGTGRPVPCPVHPHARGEHIAAFLDHSGDAGSSPRPWGTLRVRLARCRCRRFIPTPVGNTSMGRKELARISVHPHARGEHRSRTLREMADDGSSPRPWGTPITTKWDSQRDRFIPTPVGNTVRPRLRRARRPVHPHARGEHGTATPPTVSAVGSSPRPWGTHGSDSELPSSGRFIPTPVGNTPAARGSRRSAAVHPHARGEHATVSGSPVGNAGSSPRPWGTPKGKTVHELLTRFIPTPVGNTAQHGGLVGAVTVHPHARGEHGDAVEAPVQVVRFIPTPVGNTLVELSGSQPQPVHPHARGEHSGEDYPSTLVNGSSPRPWGTPQDEELGHQRARFIPTPVGNT